MMRSGFFMGTDLESWVRFLLYKSYIRETVPKEITRKKAESFAIVEVWRFWGDRALKSLAPCRNRRARL